MNTQIFKTILIVTATLFHFSVIAQDIKFCSSDEMNKKIAEKYPMILKSRAMLEKFTEEFIKNKVDTNQLYIIPLVFHIVHNYGVENISKAQVLDAVRVLNEDFRKLNPDTGQIISEFIDIAADSRIEFRLAKIDPYGNCTDGINRTVSTKTYNADDEVKYIAPAWPRANYFNVWIVRSIGSGAAGYAYYPSTWLPAAIDGVLLLHDYVGSIGTGSINRSRTLTHEIGHSFNLKHPWGDSNNCGLAENCNDDDDVDDTPNTIGNLVCNLYHESCGSLDNVQNQMDYSYCGKMFTEGQKVRMRAALNSPVSNRENLWQEENLLATGTNDGYEPQACIPIADFNYDYSMSCENSTIQFSDMSYNSDEEWTQSWSFTGAIPSSSTEQNPIVTYPDPGIYSVSLTVTVSAGNDQIIKNDIIYIINTGSGETTPFIESFESTSFPLHPDDNNKDWSIESEGLYTWERTSWASTSGYASIKIHNSGNDKGTVNSLISPNIIIDGIQDTAINFKIAYAKKTSSSNDELEVYVSYDCGKNWKFRYGRSGNSLATNGGEIVSGTFIPAPDEWRQETATLNSLYADSSYIRIKFQCTSGGGNYLYIDDINISGNTAIDDLKHQANIPNFHIYPNPFNPGFIPAKISYELFEKSNVMITVSNIFGKVLGTFTKEQIKGHYDLNLSDIVSSRLLGVGIDSGVYFIKLTTDNYSITRKLVCIN